MHIRSSVLNEYDKDLEQRKLNWDSPLINIIKFKSGELHKRIWKMCMGLNIFEPTLHCSRFKCA